MVVVKPEQEVGPHLERFENQRVPARCNPRAGVNERLDLMAGFCRRRDQRANRRQEMWPWVAVGRYAERYFHARMLPPS
jgi:hypothetical protein